MKNNKGFATSFILFSLLILFLIVISILLFTLNNSSSLNSKIKNKLKNDIETPNVYNEYNFYYTGDVQVFTAPRNCTYNIQAWSSSHNYISGNIILNKGEKLFLYVGKTNYNSGNTDIRTKYGDVSDYTSNIMRAGYNISNSDVFDNRFSNVMKNNTTPSPSASSEGFIRIYYYSINASNLGYDDKVSDKHCDNVQCIIDEISRMLKEK